MALQEALQEAAHKADDAVREAMQAYENEEVTDEDDITGVLKGQLDANLRGKIGGLTWSTTILRHRRGKAAQERALGADMLMHITLNTPEQKYSKGVLIQAKRKNPGDIMRSRDLQDLHRQCQTMMSHSAASFVFNYMPNGMRCASASKIAGSTSRDLAASCNLTSYRFFLEFFRCTIGDANIRSPRIADLQQVPHILKFTAEGQIRAGD